MLVRRNKILSQELIFCQKKLPLLFNFTQSTHNFSKEAELCRIETKNTDKDSDDAWEVEMGNEKSSRVFQQKSEKSEGRHRRGK